MSDIFNRNASQLAGVFTVDRAKLTLLRGLAVLIQQLQFNYTQMITRLYEVGANGPGGTMACYYVGGRTQGNLAVSRVVGPAGSVSYLYGQYGDVCQARNNVLQLGLTETDCSTQNSGSDIYTLKACVITSVAVGVASQDMIISETTTMMFSSLEVEGTAPNALAQADIATAGTSLASSNT